MTNEEKDKKEYELAFLVKGEEDMPAVLALVAQHNGEITLEPRAKKIALAYEIKGHTEAVFVSCGVRAYGEDMKSLENDLNTRQDVIRSLVIAQAPMAERPISTFPARRGRPRTASAEESPKPTAPRPLSNEALEKKIEEILQ